MVSTKCHQYNHGCRREAHGAYRIGDHVLAYCDDHPLPPTAPACAVRGHDHATTLVSAHVQASTGAIGFTWECPSTHAYRWFALAGNPVSNTVRQTRPRYGWKA